MKRAKIAGKLRLLSESGKALENWYGQSLCGAPNAFYAVALLGAKNRERWFFWWSTILGGIWCVLCFPYGLIVGISLIILNGAIPAGIPRAAA